MNSFMYSVKKDKSVWWQMSISLITYIVMMSVPNVRDRHYKVKIIYDNLVDIKSVLMNYFSAFCNFCKSVEVMEFGVLILVKDIENLHLYC